MSIVSTLPSSVCGSNALGFSSIFYVIPIFVGRAVRIQKQLQFRKMPQPSSLYHCISWVSHVISSDLLAKLSSLTEYHAVGGHPADNSRSFMSYPDSRNAWRYFEISIGAIQRILLRKNNPDLLIYSVTELQGNMSPELSRSHIVNMWKSTQLWRTARLLSI